MSTRRTELVPARFVLEIRLADGNQDRVVGEGAGRRRFIQCEEIRIAGAINAVFIDIHPDAFMDHRHTRHAALGNVGGHDNAAALEVPAEKLSEGIRLFAVDTVKLEKFIAPKLG